MKRFLCVTALAGAIVPSAGSATMLVNNSSGQTFEVFDTATQGVRLAELTQSGAALTFTTTIWSAVYRNTAGTLDFYYQVRRDGRGAAGNEGIERLTSSSFIGFSVDAFESKGDPDGSDFFQASTHTGADTTTVGRNNGGNVLSVLFGANDLVGNQISSTYIYRTNAARFQQGTFGVQDGSAYQGLAFAPAGGVPEPSAWALMILGIATTGFVARRRRIKVAYS